MARGRPPDAREPLYVGSVADLKFLRFRPPARRGTQIQSHTEIIGMLVSLSIPKVASECAEGACDLRNRDTGVTDLKFLQRGMAPGAIPRTSVDRRNLAATARRCYMPPPRLSPTAGAFPWPKPPTTGLPTSRWRISGGAKSRSPKARCRA